LSVLPLLPFTVTLSFVWNEPAMQDNINPNMKSLFVFFFSCYKILVTQSPAALRSITFFFQAGFVLAGGFHIFVSKTVTEV
jgi:hypothetical protein